MPKLLDSDIKKIVSAFLGWRLFLILVLTFALRILPHQNNFLGGGLGRYLENPYFWSWINFDGEHYLLIAQNGYKPLTYFYFPLYPLIIRIFTFINKSQISFATAGLLVSHFAFLLALVGMMKLIKIDFKDKIAYTALVLILLFPTSVYFVGFYAESLFLALAVWSFYGVRKKNWFLAGVLG